jgi:hypothetical protein
MIEYACMAKNFMVFDVDSSILSHDLASATKTVANVFKPVVKCSWFLKK